MEKTIEQKSGQKPKEGELRCLFGPFIPPANFQPLRPLDECEEENMEPIIEDLLYHKTYVLEHGLKETYKSWLAAYIAVCVASGKPCFGHRVVKPGKVVFIYGEGAMIRRLKAICRGMGIEMPKTLYPLRLRANLGDLKEIKSLGYRIPEGTVLLIIDNYEKYWDSHTEEKIVAPAVKFLQTVSDYATMLLIQHQPKNAPKGRTGHRNAIGSSRLVNAADSTFELKLDKRNRVVICEMYHRDAEAPANPIKFRLVKLNEDSFRLELLDGKQDTDLSDEEAPDKTYAQVVARLRISMKADDELTKTAIYEVRLKGHGIHGLSSKAYHSYFHQRLVDDGFLIEGEDGKFTFSDGRLPEVSNTSEK